VKREKEKPSRDQKLSQRCDVLAEVVVALRPVYQKAKTETQKHLLETIVGAAIWYLPACDGLFTGQISANALREWKQNGKRVASLTKEHRYPRKRAGADLLKAKGRELTGKEVLNRYRRRWGRYNFVTKKVAPLCRPNGKAFRRNAVMKPPGLISRRRLTSL
jgi:hypothetical protein